MIFLILALLTSATTAVGQIIDSMTFEKLVNQDYLPYKDKNGEFLGCGYSYECRGMSIVFYEIKVKEDHRTIFIKGRCIDPWTIGDTLGVYAVDIFLARPEGNKLRKIRRISRTSISNDTDSNNYKFPHRNGDFIIETKFGSKDRLYFIHELFRPIEYRINQLF